MIRFTIEAALVIAAGFAGSALAHSHMMGVPLW